VLEPIFEKEFAEHSYGFRPRHGCKDALRRVADLLKHLSESSGPPHGDPRLPDGAVCGWLCDPVPVRGKSSSGKPDAGKPPVRFGGRGTEINRSFLPLSFVSFVASTGRPIIIERIQIPVISW